MAQSVAVAVGNIGDDLVNQISKKVEALKVGPGMDKTSEMGPLVTKEHLERVRGYVDLGLKEGAKLIVDGRDINLQGYEKRPRTSLVSTSRCSCCSVNNDSCL